jgi:DNA adenine methylase
MINAFPWYGGKSLHLKHILPLLDISGVRHYIEPFAGSAAVLLNRPSSPIETLNDIDGEIVNFFRVLRMQEADFLKALTLTPYSRAEFEACLVVPKDLELLERARRFYVRTICARGGSPRPTLGQWMGAPMSTYRGRVRGVRRDVHARISQWFGHIESLPEIVTRLLFVEFENRDAIDVIKKYDAPDVLYYVDPPYFPRDRVAPKMYYYEAGAEYHERLSDTLRGCAGRVAISGYAGEYDRLYSGWRVVRWPVTALASVTRAKREESVWLNYSINGERI